MYGLINMAIKQLVLDNFGESGWQKVLDEAKVKQTNFEMLTIYNDDITYKLVGGACAVTGKSAEEILKLFGAYWVKYAAGAGYEPLFKLFGPTFKECMINLNRMHEHMGAMMPGLIPPEFNLEEDIAESEIILQYKSQRKGLAPMVSGLIQALSERYEVKNLQVNQLERKESIEAERFQIKWN